MFRFALKTGEPFGIMRKRFRQNFDGYVAPELGVVRLIHFAHAARAYGETTSYVPSFVPAASGMGASRLSLLDQRPKSNEIRANRK